MKWYGVLPMAGKGTRLQPIAFSKELYPVAYKQRHFAVSEFSVLAMLKANVDEIKMVIRPEKLDIPKYYATYDAPISFYFHHPNVPYSLPDSSLYPIDNLNDDDCCLFGLPDTIFSPSNGYMLVRKELEKGADIALGLFEVEDAAKFDSVACDQKGNVTAVLVKQSPPLSNWIWGIWGAKVKTLRLLKKIIEKQKIDGERLLGVGFNKLAKIKEINFKAVKIGQNYFDIGSVDGVIKIREVLDNFDL